MQSNLRPARLRAARPLLAFLAVVVAFLAFGALGSSGDSVRGCASFASQAEGQAYFMHLGGSPEQPLGELDPDHDGVACEGLTGPFQGYAAIGYNKKGGFFYGTASMPPNGPGSSEYVCLYGNRHFPDAPRRLHLFRVKSGSDRPLTTAFGHGAEAKPATGRLLWKVEQRTIVPGRYYVQFEERVSNSPYGKNPCPGFRSRAVQLP